MWIFYGVLFATGCVLGVVVLEIIERYPRTAGGSRSEEFSSTSDLWDDTATPRDIHDAIVSALQNDDAKEEECSDVSTRKGEGIDAKSGNRSVASFRAFKASEHYEQVKGLLGLTDAQIEIAFELAKKGKRLPQPRTVRVVRCLDNAFLLILLGILGFALYQKYSWVLGSRWLHSLFPKERALIGGMVARAGDGIASFTRMKNNPEEAEL